MDTSMGIDWCDYLHCLSDDQIYELAEWLDAEFLKVSEFTDIVDRVYAQASDESRAQSPATIVSHGRPVVERYAERKRGFAKLVALDEAYMSGALPEEVASQELRPPRTEPRGVEEVLRVLERVRGGS